MVELPSALLEISRVLARLGVRVILIGARSIELHGVDIGRETRDWDTAVDKPFTPELREAITRELRSKGYVVQWRKWGFMVRDDIDIDINYAPLTLDEEFIARCGELAENLLLPSLEDIIVLKLMSGEKKDIQDLKRMLHQTWGALDKDYLFRRARQAGLERELERILKRIGLL